MKIAVDRDLYSLGRLSQRYQESPRMVKAALDGLDCEAELSLNGLYYFAISDEIDRRLRELFAELEKTRRENDELNKGARWTPTLPIPQPEQ